MMKILLVHNDYAKYSGEEAVVDKMHFLFQSLGHQVCELRMTTAGSRDNLGGQIKGFISGIYSPKGVKAMREILMKERPDIVNVHNLYPFISPAALRECKKMGIPVVMTVHNYRLICPTGLFTRDKRICEYCLQKGNEWGCVKYNCENSIPKSIGYAARNAAARLRKDYLECVDMFACLTLFQRQKLIEAGFPEEKLTVIPNFIDNIPASITYPNSIDSSYVAYAGRLSEEKGIDLILETAHRNPDIRFKFAGALNLKDEKLKKELMELPNVYYQGYLTGQELEDFYRNAAFFVMASKWYEGFPMTILETGSFGKTMVAPAHGGFPEIIDGIGKLFTPGDAESLEKAIRELWDNRGKARDLGEKTFNKISTDYSFKTVASKWEKLLEQLPN